MHYYCTKTFYKYLIKFVFILEMFSSDGSSKRIRVLQVLIVLACLIGTILYVVDIRALEQLPAHIHFRLTGEPIWNWELVRAQQEHEWDKSYFVDTIGCKMPSFPVLNEKIETFMRNETQVYCKPALTKSNNNYLWIALNRSEISSIYGVDDVSKLNCFYESVLRHTDCTNKYQKIESATLDFGEIVKINGEFIRVICEYDNVGEIYSDYHYFVPKVEQNVLAPNKVQHTSETSYPRNTNKLNILIIGIDSVSRLNFHRQMHQTSNIIMGKLKAIELFGYNKVEDNTYPNLIPVLTGLDESELASTCLPYKNSTYDKCHFIWNIYKQNGYQTLFAEDMASLGLFNYLRKGFIQQPTDYNIRPVLVEMENHIAYEKKGNAHLCLGGRRPVDIILDYMTKFIYSIGTSPYFSFFWTTSYTHDFLNYPRLIDSDFATILNNLSDSDALNNTFLILMSDHGIRWGQYRNTYQGMMEERQPFLYLIPPKWFPDAYPNAIKNLLSNRRKLTSHFDLYETLRDLVDVSTLTAHSIKDRSQELLDIEPMPRGISLFLPVPSSRTCYLAGISPHWCTCHEKQFISTTDSKVQRVARMIVQGINQMVKLYPQCQTLSLNSISDANLGISNRDIVGKNISNHFSDVTVRLQTKPGFAEFEATVRVHEDGELELTGSISRTNLYGKQSQCVDDYKIKLYCFCDSFL